MQQTNKTNKGNPMLYKNNTIRRKKNCTKTNWKFHLGERRNRRLWRQIKEQVQTELKLKGAENSPSCPEKSEKSFPWRFWAIMKQNSSTWYLVPGTQLLTQLKYLVPGTQLLTQVPGTQILTQLNKVPGQRKGGEGVC